MSKAISPKEFKRHLQAEELVITLVGMSNVGKTHWSRRLVEEQGFTYICCDDLIEAGLGNVLQVLGYSGGIADMAKWLGQPYEARFPKNQQAYIDLEIATLRSIIKQLEQGSLHGNIIIDTTGSVVHTNPAICNSLRALSTVVYLEATSGMRQEMFNLYMTEPKPVVWGDIYVPKAGETPEEALARCYPELLAYRSGRYAAMSHVAISRKKALDINDSHNLLESIVNSLSGSIAILPR